MIYLDDIMKALRNEYWNICSMFNTVFITPGKIQFLKTLITLFITGSSLKTLNK